MGVVENVVVLDVEIVGEESVVVVKGLARGGDAEEGLELVFDVGDCVEKWDFEVDCDVVVCVDDDVHVFGFFLSF